MTEADWTKIKYFRPHEFDSPDFPGSGATEMHREFIEALHKVREQCGFPFFINSGFRTESHNAAVGGVDSSSHVRGWAADIKCKTTVHRSRIITFAVLNNITRIGIANTFIHVDMDPSLPPGRVWLY